MLSPCPKFFTWIYILIDLMVDKWIALKAPLAAGSDAGLSVAS